VAGCRDSSAPRVGGGDGVSAAFARINTAIWTSVRSQRIKRVQEPRTGQEQRIPVRDLVKIVAQPRKPEFQDQQTHRTVRYAAAGPSAADHRLFQGEVTKLTKPSIRTNNPSTPEKEKIMDMKFEVAVIPVSDVDLAKTFYDSLGFRMDIDYVGADDFRVVQFTPPGSEASIIIGSNVTSAAPGSTQGVQLVVWDIEKAHEELVGRGIDVSDVFHDVGGIFHHAGTDGRVTGPAPDRDSYGSFLSFNDPDGNGWIIQEVQTRAPGR